MKLGIRVGRWLNEYISSYGQGAFLWKTPFRYIVFWPRRNFVRFICEIISCIDEKEYKACRSTVAYKEQLVEGGINA